MKLYVRGHSEPDRYFLAEETLINHLWFYYHAVHGCFYGSVGPHELLKTHVNIVDLECLWGHLSFEKGFVLKDGL